MKESSLHKIHDYMVAELEKKGATIHEIAYYPHKPKTRCECRKPNSKIKLTSTLSVISTVDPVRVNGGHFRTFLESFSLFGTSLDDYDKLFEEKLGLFMQLQEKDVVHWHGEFRSPLNDEHKGLPL